MFGKFFKITIMFSILITGCSEHSMSSKQPPKEPAESARVANSDQQLAETLERFLSLRAAGKHHEAFLELRKEIERTGRELIISPVGPSDFAPDPKHEKAFAIFQKRMESANSSKASGHDQEASNETWLAIESCPIQATLLIKGTPYSLSSSYDEVRATSGIEELLRFLKTEK